MHLIRRCRSVFERTFHLTVAPTLHRNVSTSSMWVITLNLSLMDTYRCYPPLVSAKSYNNNDDGGNNTSLLVTVRPSDNCCQEKLFRTISLLHTFRSSFSALIQTNGMINLVQKKNHDRNGISSNSTKSNTF